MKNKNLFQKLSLAAFVVAVFAVQSVFSQSSLPSPRQEKLLNGLKILMWSDAKADKVSVKIRIHAGSAFDPQGREGLMQMLADNIFPNEASREFFTDDLGGGLEIVTNYDYIQINASSKPEFFTQMMETLSTAVSNPLIDKETTAKLRTALLTKVAAMEADPAYVADRAVAKRLFGTFPYGRPLLGTADSVKKIDFADLTDAKARFLTADNATVAISGNFDQSLGFKAIRRFFGSWLKSDKKVPATFRQPDEPLTAVFNVLSPKPEVSAVRLGMRGVSRRDKSFAASMVFTKILENRLKTANFLNPFVRNDANILPGMITIGYSSGFTPQTTKVFTDPITDAEFQAAKNIFQSSWKKRESSEFWLDADTYALVSADFDSKIADNVSIADVNSFFVKTGSLPVVSILLSPAPAK